MSDISTDATTDLSADLDLLEADEPEVKTQEPLDTKVKNEPLPDETEDDDSEESESEESDEEETKGEGKDLLPHERPTVAQLKAAFPDVFKKFPALRDMFFREVEYSKVFPTPADAREAQENSENYTILRDEVLSGNANKLFTAIKETDEKSLEKLAPQILPALNKISKDLHWQAVTPILENVVRSFYQTGVRSNNEDLQNAAMHLSEYLFGDVDIASGKKTFQKVEVKSEDDPERKKFEDERKAFEVQKYTDFFGRVDSKAVSGLQEMILERGAGNRLKIDPEGEFSEFIKTSIKDKIISEVGKIMTSDKAHMSYMDSLWAKAKKAGYAGDWEAKILSAYLARAKSLVPAVRSRLVSEALGRNPSEQKKEAVQKTASRREPGTGGKHSNGAPRTYDAKKVDWSKTSDEDLMDDRVTFKQ